MSDAEIIVHFLKNIERRLRANRSLRDITFALSIVLTFLTFIKVWDLISPFKTAMIRFFLGSCALFLFGYAVWLLRKKETLDQAAGSIDQTARLNDEIKTAFWFISNPHPSNWVDRQIQRAASTAARIDLTRAYPIVIPRASYGAVTMTLVLLGLNFLPLPFNHNWLVLRAAPEIARSETVARTTAATSAPRASLVREISKDTPNMQSIYAGLQKIASRLKESETLRGVSRALTDKRLALAAEELRAVATVLDREPVASLLDIEHSLNEAAEISRPELEALSDELAAAARSIANKNMTGAREALEQAAEEFEGLEEEIYKQESTLEQLAKGNERHAEEDGHVSGAAIPEARDLPQKKGSGEGFGVSENKSDRGPYEGSPTRLGVKLQQEAVEGMRSAGVSREDVGQASRQERSTLDYHAIEAKSTGSPKDVLDHRESTPWKYRALIKSYFEAIGEPAAK